eukprot:364933-Chlamydomonas_euryale.AAC.7
MSFASSCACMYSGRFFHGALAAMTLRFTSPHAASVEPMFLMTVEKTVLRSCLSTPCNWNAWRVVRRNVPLPYCEQNAGTGASVWARGRSASMGTGHAAEARRHGGKWRARSRPGECRAPTAAGCTSVSVELQAAGGSCCRPTRLRKQLPVPLAGRGLPAPCRAPHAAPGSAAGAGGVRDAAL